MITPSYYSKKEIDEAARKKDYAKVSQLVANYIAENGQIKEKEALLKEAGDVTKAMMDRQTVILDQTDSEAYLIPMLCYYITTRKPVVIATASFETQKRLFKKVEALYRSITGEKARTLSITGNEAEILFINGVEDPELHTDGVRFNELRINSLVNDCIVFCSQYFLIKDRQRTMDEYGLTNALLSSKYDTYLVADADQLDDSAARADGVFWDYATARRLLDICLFLTEGLDSGVKEVKDARCCLADLLDQIIDLDVTTIDFKAFKPLLDSIKNISLLPVSDWGSFYSDERKEAYVWAVEQIERQIIDLTRICSGADKDTITITHRLGRTAYSEEVLERLGGKKSEHYNTYVHFAENVKKYDGVAKLREIIGDDPNMSLVIVK